MEPGSAYEPGKGDKSVEVGGERAKLASAAARGAALLAGAAILTKLIGVLQKIPLQNLAGDRVFGIYNAVYPFYQLIAVVATAGLPTAVAIIIAEKLKEGGRMQDTRSTLYAALLLLGVTGAGGFAAMWLLAGQAARWIGDAQTALAIQAVSVALLFAPIAAALRGYMQGFGRMGASAGSQVAEQTIRVAVMIVVLAAGISAGWSDASIAAGVMSGSAAGALAASLLLSGYTWRRAANRRRDTAETAGAMTGSRQTSLQGREGLSYKAVWRELERLAIIALPVALGAVAVPMLGVVDAFTIPRLLQEGGAAEGESMVMFGIYSRAQPLVQLVVMVAGAAASALVPSLVQARMNGDKQTIHKQLSITMRASWSIGLAASVGLAVLAREMNIMLYTDVQGTLAFALVGCTALAGSLNAVAAPLLQSLGAIRTPAVLLLLAALLKGALNAALVPLMGIEGAALAGVAALTAAALLGAAAVGHMARAAGAPPEPPAAWLRRAAATALALAVMAAALALLQRGLGPALAGLPPRAAATALALTGTAVGACAFGAAAVRGGAISARELRALPGGGKLAARLIRWRIMPRQHGDGVE